MTPEPTPTRADEWAAEEHATAVREQRGCWHCLAIAQGMRWAAQGGIPLTPDPNSPPEGWVWVGDLSGWEIVPIDQDGIAMAHPGLELRHRCGRRVQQPESGITGDGAAFLGNLVENCVEENDGHTCTPHQPSPEHQARVARWMAAAGMEPSGDVAQDQLALVRAMVSKGPRTVDGPGCTPAFVPGALEAFRDVANKTAATGHGPEDYPEEPADIPVRRLVDGKWQTVEVTMSDFRANEGADGRQPYRVKPDVVANEVGDDVPAGSLYADKCAECTTGVSCEDARRCLFEG